MLEQATGAKKNVIVAEVGWLLAGAHHFKVMASNSRGDGAESEEAVIKVPAKQAA